VLRRAREETGERDIVVELVSPTRKFYPRRIAYVEFKTTG
jgi:hypothetical protein